MQRTKRILSGLFLVLIAFNTIGYYGLLVVVQRQLTSQVLQKIDTNADELGGNLILAIPIESPYSSDSEEYTRLDGEIIYGGEVYRLVKQKFYRDMLYVVCMKDNEGNKVRSAMCDYSRAFSGQQAENTNSNIKTINALFKYYISMSFRAQPHHEGWCRVDGYAVVSDGYQPLSLVSIFHPPQFS